MLKDSHLGKICHLYNFGCNNNCCRFSWISWRRAQRQVGKSFKFPITDKVIDQPFQKNRNQAVISSIHPHDAYTSLVHQLISIFNSTSMPIPWNLCCQSYTWWCCDAESMIVYLKKHAQVSSTVTLLYMWQKQESQQLGKNICLLKQLGKCLKRHALPFIAIIQ